MTSISSYYGLTPENPGNFVDPDLEKTLLKRIRELLGWRSERLVQRYNGEGSVVGSLSGVNRSDQHRQR